MECRLSLWYTQEMSIERPLEAPDSNVDKLAPQQKRSREARKRIIIAAETVLRENGVEGFSMAAVATAANMPIGNIYRRFDGKDDLLQAMKDIVSGRIRNGIADYLAVSTHENLRCFFSAFARAVELALSRDEQLNRALYHPRLVNPSLAKSGQIARASIFDVFSAGLHAYVAEMEEERRTLVTKVAFSIIMNAAALKVRDNDSISASISWPELSGEFGDSAFFYVASKLKSVE